ncbi:cupin domain-containing protein [Kitasatospora viridis]|uniref:Cupin domain n=1 Tax=Kitasatospora viridis TaxID=281105 RepID=A0A561UCA5_9ACTN|nr:cupin domain-containing protein [Kitasatospora viridis]TWF96994.1 cupin domain [Kitasatospora viridis]
MAHEIRPLDRAALKPDNQLRAQRLVPWPLLNAPFEGSWCVVAPGTESGEHGHHEYEIWIALFGASEIRTEGKRVPFVAGDVIHFEPNTVHQVVNSSDADFEFYAIWWDADLAGGFLAKHRAGPHAGTGPSGGAGA